MKGDGVIEKLKAVVGLFVKVLITVAVTLLLLECGFRTVLSLSLDSYLTKILPQPYGAMMRRAGLFDCSARCRSLSVVKFDRLCYFIPREGFFRGPKGRIDCAKEKVAHEIRIICIGDSTTYGFAVDYYNSWVYLLGKKLMEEYPKKNIRVLNAGLPGASPRQVKRFFQFYIASYHPDLLIWRSEASLTDAYFVNEASDSLRFLAWRCLYESRIFRVACVLLDRGVRSTRSHVDVVHDFLTDRNPHNQKHSEVFDSDFSMVRQIALEHGTRYVLQVERLYCDNNGVISSPLGGHTRYGQWPVAYTLAAFQEYQKNNFSKSLLADKVYITDAGEVIIPPEKFKNDPSKGLFVDNVHLTEAGEALTAEEVSKFIINSKWIETFN